MIAIDLETWRILPGRLAPRPVCLAWATGPRPSEAGLVAGPGIVEAARTTLRRALAAGDLVITHNAAFDLGVLAEAGLLDEVLDLYDAGLVSCTLIREKLRKIALGTYRIEPAQPWRGAKGPSYSLAALAREYLGIDIEASKGADSWRLRYHDLDGVPIDDWPEAARRYPQDDATLAWRIWGAQRPPSDLDVGEGRWPDEAAQVQAAFALHVTGARGIRTDATAIDALEARLRAEVDGVATVEREAGILRPNGTRNLDAIRVRVARAWETRGLRPPETPTGGVSTSADALARSGDPLLAASARVAKDRTELATFVPVLRRGTRTAISPSYDPLVATGRTSSREPNLQNLPRRPGVRECVVARPGRWFVAADYAAAELFAFAQVLLDTVGWSRLAEVLREGKDPHALTGAAILGTSYSDLVERLAAGDPDAKNARQCGKAANFGIGGGPGPDRFVDFARETYRIDLVRAQAQAVIEAVKETYPEIRDYFRAVGEAVDEGAGRATLRYRSGRVYLVEGFTAACNAPFQGAVADGAKLALWRVVREILRGGDGLAGASPAWFLHDEIALEVDADPDIATAAADALVRTMVAALGEQLPDLAGAVHCDVVAMVRWSKAAKEVRDYRGRLVAALD